MVLDVAASQKLVLPGTSSASLEPLLRGTECAALAAAGALLKGLPAALMAAPAAAAPPWMPALAVPESLMLAVYPGGGAYYARHVDNDAVPQQPAAWAGGAGAAETRAGWPAARPAAGSVSTASWQGPPGQRVADRAVTAILYLNSDWDAEQHGGQLRLHHADGSITDVEPQAGRLVLFDSRWLEHEVRPAWRRRWALSAWIPAREAYLH